MLTTEETARLLELRAQVNGLPLRQAMVLYAVCEDGLQNKAIACRLRLSNRSVETARAALYRAMGVETPAALGRLYGEWRTLERLALPDAPAAAAAEDAA